MKNTKFVSLTRTFITMVLALIGLVTPKNLKAQISSNTGGWADVTSNKDIVSKDLIDIAYNTDCKKLKPNKSYMTSIGVTFSMPNPQLWHDSMLQIVNMVAYAKGKPKYDSLYKVFQDPNFLIKDWNGGPKARNLFVSGGVVSVKDNYSGGVGVRAGFLYGEPIIKVKGPACLNPQDPYIYIEAPVTRIEAPKGPTPCVNCPTFVGDTSHIDTSCYVWVSEPYYEWQCVDVWGHWNDPGLTRKEWRQVKKERMVKKPCPKPVPCATCPQGQMASGPTPSTPKPQVRVNVGVWGSSSWWQPTNGWTPQGPTINNGWTPTGPQIPNGWTPVGPRIP